MCLFFFCFFDAPDRLIIFVFKTVFELWCKYSEFFEIKKRVTCVTLFSFMLNASADARSHPESGSDGGEDGDGDVQYFLPDFLLIHSFK